MTRKLVTTLCEAGVQVRASGEGDAPPSFTMLAYTGAAIRQFWSEVPLVVDLAGLDVSRQKRPVRSNHWGGGIGHTTEVVAADGRLTAAGVVSRDSAAATDFIQSAKKGFPWQASIGADVIEIERVKAGGEVEVNGRRFSGPIDVIRKAQLLEISVVELGADQDTATALKAMHHTLEARYPMDPTTQNPNPTPTPTPPVPTPAPAPAPTPAVDPAILASREAQARETERVAGVRRVAAGHPAVEAQAIREGWTVDATELHVLRASRPAVGVHAGHGPGMPSGVSPWRVIEAAALQAGRLPAVERQGFSDAELQAAHTRFRGRIGLQELILEAAWMSGYHGRSFRSDPRGVLQAAFSSRDISGILSNVANKFLLMGWNAVEGAWREICAIRPVSDFKEISSYRLTGDLKYSKVGADGEIEHGDLGELAYGNKADTYAKMLAVTRQDLINDDLSAITTGAPVKLGRGAGLKVNEVCWAEFLDNSDFFKSDNANYITGATAGETTESRLSIDGLTRAEKTFLDQTDTEGDPVGLMPKILLVPTALKVAAEVLMNSTEVRDTTASTKYATVNPHAGKLKPVVSAYLGNSRFTGYSSKKWYVLADPNELPVIEGAFLNGAMEPTVENAEADFNTLGIQMRGYHDFGFRLQDHRGGVAAKGEA